MFRMMGRLFLRSYCNFFNWFHVDSTSDLETSGIRTSAEFPYVAPSLARSDNAVQIVILSYY